MKGRLGQQQQHQSLYRCHTAAAAGWGKGVKGEGGEVWKREREREDIHIQMVGRQVAWSLLTSPQSRQLLSSFSSLLSHTIDWLGAWLKMWIFLFQEREEMEGFQRLWVMDMEGMGKEGLLDLGDQKVRKGARGNEFIYPAYSGKPEKERQEKKEKWGWCAGGRRLGHDPCQQNNVKSRKSVKNHVKGKGKELWGLGGFAKVRGLNQLAKSPSLGGYG